MSHQPTELADSGGAPKASAKHKRKQEAVRRLRRDMKALRLSPDAVAGGPTPVAGFEAGLGCTGQSVRWWVSEEHYPAGASLKALEAFLEAAEMAREPQGAQEAGG